MIKGLVSIIGAHLPPSPQPPKVICVLMKMVLKGYFEANMMANLVSGDPDYLLFQKRGPTGEFPRDA